MASFAEDRIETGVATAPARVSLPLLQAPGRVDRLARLHERLADGAIERVVPHLLTARARAARVAATAGGDEAADALAASVYAGEVVVALAADGDLEAADSRIVVAALARVRDESVAAASFDLYLRAVASPALLELPPVVAAETQLRLLLHLDVAAEASLWRRVGGAQVECVLALGGETTSRRVRAAAKAAITGRGGLRLIGSSGLRTAQVRRFGQPVGAVVIRTFGDPGRDLSAYLDAAATALAPVLERELLLERDAARERALVAAGEQRLMRLGFDLHDGPIQNVLALASETRQFQEQLYPFVLETHRELAHGRFEDVLARLADVDRELRELAHSLETKSIVSRPVAEILHREVDGFVERTGIEATVEVRGDPESLSPAQRIAVFRAIQESLANVREHSGATAIEVRVRARRSTVDVHVTDNGQGFEVSQALARAAQRGRLGLIGIGERVRILGGTFEIDSRPGGPTSLHFSLPRWEPFSPVDP